MAAAFKKLQDAAGIGLANAGGTPEEIKRVSQERELMKACFKSDVDTIKALLGEGINPNTPMSANTTPFQISCSRGLDNAILKDMISKGANVAHTNQIQFTALHMAALNGKKDTCKFLVEQGALKDTKSLNGQTPADLAEVHGFREELE